MATKINSDRIPTNIPGLDKHIQDGFVKGSCNLVIGGAGTGKTIFAMQFAHNQIKSGRNVLYVSFEESIDSILNDALKFGWDFNKAVKNGTCVFSVFQPIGSPETYSQFVDTCKKYNISIIIIDSVSVMNLAFEDNYYKMRKELYTIVDTIKKLGCTSLMTAEVNGEASLDISGGSVSRDGMSEFVADSVITLHNAGLGGEGDRALRVLKMRRTKHTREPMGMEINAKGIAVLK